MFYSIHSVQEFIETEAWQLLSFFIFTQLINLYIPLLYIEEYRCLKKVIHQNDQINSKSERLLLLGNFTAKFELVFVLTHGKAFS